MNSILSSFCLKDLTTVA